MSADFDINKLWNQQIIVAAPNKEELLKKAGSYKNKLRLRIILSNLLLVATAVFIVLVWATYHPEMLTTKIGIVLVIIAIAAFVVTSGSRLQFLFKSDEENDTSTYLKQLILLKQKQDFLQTTMMTFYFIVLSAGIYLYMIEYTLQMTLFWAIFTYAITTAWFAFNWFYTRPKTAKKNTKVLNEMIEKLQQINNQFTAVNE